MQIFDDRRKTVLQMLGGLAREADPLPAVLGISTQGLFEPEPDSGDIGAWASRSAGIIKDAGEGMLQEAAEWAAAAEDAGPQPDISDARHASGAARHGGDFALRRLLEALRRFPEVSPEGSSGPAESRAASPAAVELMSAVAECLRCLKDPESAILLHVIAHSERKRALGPSHPCVAESLTGLADSICDMGKYQSAFPAREEALAVRKKAFGAGHPSSLAALHDLAETHVQVEDFGRARDLLRRAVSGRRNSLGPGHPDTAASVAILALCEMECKSAGQALAHLKQGLSDARQALGPGHPSVRKSAAMLASLYWKHNDDKSVYELRLAMLAERRERLLSRGRPSPLAAALAEPCGDDEFSALSGGDQAARARLLGDSPQAAFADVFRSVALAIETCAFESVMESGQFPFAARRPARQSALTEAGGKPGYSDGPERDFRCGEALLGLGANSIAMHYHGEALKARAKAFGMAHPDTVFSLLAMAEASLAACDPSYSRTFAGNAWEALLKIGKPQRTDPETELAALERLAAVQMAAADLAGHAAVLERIVALLDKKLGRGHPRSLRHATALSVLHALNGDAAKARKYRKLSLEAQRRLRGGGGKP
ncbi:MAG: tetratricopeptide repeat protein [Deltaproteobacteria bacterium]|jgi:hypothetical protein|nr:tetratricopeptide repeat protein [Deltaproteobacteria bacterium]